ncbi:hypothetical protein OG21DRAFT_1483812 [Imleria badia]|nr:hypothetical protein OG21DRAFT_1483812 [Imleria badia]
MLHRAASLPARRSDCRSAILATVSSPQEFKITSCVCTLETPRQRPSFKFHPHRSCDQPAPNITASTWHPQQVASLPSSPTSPPMRSLVLATAYTRSSAPSRRPVDATLLLVAKATAFDTLLPIRIATVVSMPSTASRTVRHKGRYTRIEHGQVRSGSVPQCQVENAPVLCERPYWIPVAEFAIVIVGRQEIEPFERFLKDPEFNEDVIIQVALQTAESNELAGGVSDAVACVNVAFLTLTYLPFVFHMQEVRFSQ